MKKTVLNTALAAVFGVAAMGAQAATLNAGDVLTIESGVYNTDAYGNPTSVASGSWFGMDTNADSKIAGTEQTTITGLAGISIGATQPAGEIDTWEFFGNTGTHYTTVAPTGDTTTGVDLSGWSVFWNNVNVPMGTGAWTPGNCGAPHMGCTGITFANGLGALSWSGTYGDSYELWYSATVPDGDPSGFGNVQYIVYYTGIVQGETPPPEIPVPAAVWLLGSGLVGLVGVARRRRARA